MPRTILCLAIAVFFSLPLHAQEKWHLEKVGQDEGLMQNTINDFIEDKTGNLLIATGAGINVYDGRHFFNPLPLENTSLRVKPNPVMNRFLKAKGDTVIGYSYENKMCYYISQTKIIRAEPYSLERHGIIVINEYSFFPLPAFLQKEKDKSKVALFEFDINSDYEKIHLKNDTLMVLKRKEEILIYNNDGLVTNYRLPAHVSDILTLSDKILFIYNNELYQADSRGFHKAVLSQKGFRLSRPLFLLNRTDKKGYMCNDRRIYELEESGATITIHSLTNPLEIPDDTRIIWKKNNATFIMGSWYNALFVGQKNIFSISQPSEHSANYSFYSQVLMPDRQTIRANGWLFRNGTYIGRDPYLFDRYAVFQDSHRNIWTWEAEAIWRYSPDAQQRKKIGATPDFIRYYFEENGRLWLFGFQNLYYIDHDSLYTHLPLSEMNQQLTTDKITFVTRDRKGTLYIGTELGLYTGNGKLPASLVKMNEFDGIQVRYVYCDENNNVFVCTYGNGLACISGGKTRFVWYPKAPRYTHSIIDDGSGNFWIPSNTGLYVVNKEAILQYCVHNGPLPFFYVLNSSNTNIKTNEFNGRCQPAFLQLDKTTYSLPSFNGLVSFSPSPELLDFRRDSILLLNIWRDQIPVAAQDLYCFSITPDVSLVRLRLQTPTFLSKDNLQFEFQIVPAHLAASEINWTPVNETQLISFAPPKPGDYRLEIRKRVSLASDGFVYKKISFSVIEKWYQSRWFYWLATITVILILIAYYSYLIFRLQKKRKNLASIITHATEELRTANLQLQNKIQVNNRLIAIFAHDVLSPIRYIRRALNIVNEDMEPGSALRTNVSEIIGSTEMTENVIEKIVTWLRIKNKNFNFRPFFENVLLVSFIEQKKSELANYARSKKNAVIIDIPPDAEVYTDEKIFGIIFFNLLHNAIKFTHSGTIRVTARDVAASNSIELSVIDTGIGIKPDQLAEINNSMVVRPEGTEGELGNGFGLIIVKELAASIQLKITISSIAEEGTTVSVLIPKSRTT